MNIDENKSSHTLLEYHKDIRKYNNALTFTIKLIYNEHKLTYLTSTFKVYFQCGTWQHDIFWSIYHSNTKYEVST